MKDTELSPSLEKPKKRSGIDQFDETILRCLRCGGWYNWWQLYDRVNDFNDCNIAVTTRHGFHFAIPVCDYCKDIKSSDLYADYDPEIVAAVEFLLKPENFPSACRDFDCDV